MSYKIRLTLAARRGLASAPKNMTQRLDTCILALVDEPYPNGASKLVKSENLWRVRVGDYRIIYQVEDNHLVVLVVKVRPRKDIYK